MSLPDQERNALEKTWKFLLDLGNSYGPYKRVPSNVRQEAHDLVKHFPLGGDTTALVRDAEEADCTAVIWHGPGHQSNSTCERKGKHRVHAIRERYPEDTLLWCDENATHYRYDSGSEGWHVCSGFFNESPLSEDVVPDDIERPTCPSCGLKAVERRADNSFYCTACLASNERPADWEVEEA